MRTLFLATILTLFLTQPAAAETKCAELLDKNCTSCHYKTRICAKIGKKSKRGWKISVKRMLRYGLSLNKNEQKEIVQCLTELKKGSKLVCE